MGTDAAGEGRPDLISTEADATGDHGSRREGGPGRGAHEELLASSATELTAILGFDGYPLEVNQALSVQLGWTDDELAAVSWWELLHPDDQHDAVEDVERLMVTGGSREREFRMVRRGGSWVRVAASVQCAEPGCEQFQIRGTVLGEADVPPALADMWWWSVDTGRLQLRGELAAMIGGDGSGADYQQWIEHLHPADRSRVREVAETWASAGEAYSEDYRIVTRDGDIRWWHVTGRARAGASGRVETVRGLIRDTTSTRIRSTDRAPRHTG